jgi:hypothetical protein
MSNNGGMPLGELQASGNSNLRDGDQYWGYVNGAVTKRAARVRVLFDLGIPPLDLEPIQAGNRFPVNFFAGFYRMPGKDARPATWQVVGSWPTTRPAGRSPNAGLGAGQASAAEPATR